MAIRGIIHTNEIHRFEGWLVDQGWTIEKPLGETERVRAQSGVDLLSGLKRSRTDHLSFADRHGELIRRYVEWRRANGKNRSK